MLYQLSSVSHSLSTLCHLCVLGAATWTPPTSPSPPSVTITTSADTLYPGFTKDLTLTCGFNHSQLSHFGMAISLILSKSDSEEDDGRFSEIAAITAMDTDHADVEDPLGGHVTGGLSTSRDSHITYTWHYPPRGVTGRYMCTVHGMDDLGHPISSSASTVLREREMDLDSILQKMQEMDLAVEAHKLELDGYKEDLRQQNATIAKQAKTITDVKNQLSAETLELSNQKANFEDLVSRHDNLQTRFKDLVSRQNMTRSAMTQNSTVFQGHKYVISRLTWWDVPMAEVMCRSLFGGYLVEIDDDDELSAVQNLIRSSVDGFDFSHESNIIGGTDEGREGKWTFLYSDKPITFFNWHSGYSGTGGRWNTTAGVDNNCLFLSRSQLKMWDNPCVRHDLLARFICEIP